ncbi:MAG TPA: bifunctional UDP-N-acetylglucosamine diphosphorylase/glucosamine-1-phosphate N-acetyltransferase GlmU [Rhizomicrobium sp.]|nr:bifunctional UDP-N-acetylglucosamine diphosphorylase/glucosamine-1-phosphate N-acetyltransferase GlmU [Rhizomicrobium sp.]
MSHRAGIILAAGQGTRMKSATPKVMHEVAGLPMLGHVIAAMRGAGIDRIVVVSAPGMDGLRAFATSLGAANAIQHEQHGTGHAAASAREALAAFDGALLINNGDMPLARAEMMAESLASAERQGFSVVAFQPEDPAHYGRVLLDADGLLDRIVEYKDATQAQRRIDLCCAGTYSAASARRFFEWASKLSNANAQKEYYLPEVPSVARADGVKSAVTVTDAITVMGVNSRAELAAAEAQMQKRLRAKALEAGVGMIAPETVFLSYDTVLEPDVQLEPNIVFEPGVTVRSGARIRAFSHIEGAEVAGGAIVGPYARLRPGAVIEEDVHIGNFVEVKKARIEKGAKANHLAYIGDARVGAGANIGAGTITCNYDGFDKHFTDIGAGAFIGSDSALVAPVKVADGAYVGAGSVITKDVGKDALAVTRAEQREIAGWAERFRARKRAEKQGNK